MPILKDALNLYDDAGAVYGLAVNEPLALPESWTYRPDSNVASGTEVTNPRLLPGARVSVVVPNVGTVIVPDACLDWGRELAVLEAMKRVRQRAAQDLQGGTPSFDLRKDRIKEIAPGTWAVLGTDGESVMVHADNLTALDAKTPASFVPYVIDAAGRDAPITKLRALVQNARGILVSEVKDANQP